MNKAKFKKASEEFVVGKHNIGYIWDSFKNEFSNDKLTPGKILSFQKLSRDMKDSEIISELGVQECTLGDVLATLDAATEDMKDGYWNIFYIKGRSRVVRVGWDAGRGEWSVNDWGRDDYSWSAGLRVFSPATGPQSSSSKSSDSLTLNLEKAIKIVKEAGYQISKIL